MKPRDPRTVILPSAGEFWGRILEILRTGYLINEPFISDMFHSWHALH